MTKDGIRIKNKNYDKNKILFREQTLKNRNRNK